MKENKNNEIQMDSLEQVAGGCPPAVEKLTEEIDAMTAKALDMVKKTREGFANGTVSLQEMTDVLSKACEMYKIAEEKAKQRADILFAFES